MKKSKSMNDIHYVYKITDIRTGEFIRNWECIIDAKRELGIAHISHCCKGRQKTAGGYVWKYEVEN